MIVFDIETGPLAIDQIRSLMPPFDDAIEPFDPLSVKVGNLKDPQKIKEKVKAAQEEHEAKAREIPKLRQAHEEAFLEKAALSPLTGQVLAIGCKQHVNDYQIHLNLGDEREIIRWFWDFALQSPDNVLVGFNIFGFDLPFLIRRSWLLEIDVPDSVLIDGRYWSSQFVDLMRVWGCGSRSEFVKLQSLALAMGIDGKPDGINGGDFSRLFFGSDAERAQAVDYLKNDLDMTWHVATRMQILA